MTYHLDRIQFVLIAIELAHTAVSPRHGVNMEFDATRIKCFGIEKTKLIRKPCFQQKLYRLNTHQSDVDFCYYSEELTVRLTVQYKLSRYFSYPVHVPSRNHCGDLSSQRLMSLG